MDTEYWSVPPAVRERMQEVARQFRKAATPSEQRLWAAVRRRQLMCRKFRRQQPIGPFVVDFFCASERLIVEVDGPIHASQENYDRERQQLLETLGLHFVRVRASDVENDLTAVINTIVETFQKPTSG